MLTQSDKLFFQEHGYIIKTILTSQEVAILLQKIQQCMNVWPDKTAMMNIQFLQPQSCIQNIHDIIYNDNMIEVCKEILNGGDIILDGASLFYGQAGINYKQGWHRDVLQLPEQDIKDEWYTPQYFHNNIQINIPLIEDNCLWVIDGSHTRQFNAEEMSIFNGAKKMSPVDAKPLSAGKSIIVQPGQAVFYNNLLIHRGYAPILQKNRITIQLGYHSTSSDPTYHFSVLNHHEWTAEYLASLEPKVANTLKRHILEKNKYPQMQYYYQLHQEFIKHNFATQKTNI